jgi:hypothetical protein
MRNEKVNKRTLAVAAVVAMLVATTVISIATTAEDAFADKRHQAKSETSRCGNGSMPTNIGCQNIDSQTQGDGNVVALRALQTFPQNNPPIANAGPDREVPELSAVALDGSGSFDPDGDPLTYSWSQTAGPEVTLSDSTAVSPSFITPSEGGGNIGVRVGGK